MEPTEVPTGGAAGEPVAPAADGSQINADDIIKALDAPPPPAEGAPKTLDAAFLKQLESLDPRELPTALRTKLEDPFLSQYTTKTTEWQKERDAFADKERRLLSVIDRLSNPRPGDPVPTTDQRDLIRQRIQEGDMTAVEELVTQLYNQRVEPQMRQLAMNNAVSDAVRLNPHLQKYEMQVAQALTADPALAEMASIGNHKYGARVLAGLAWMTHAQALEQENKELRDSLDKKVRAAIDETQRRLRSLPSSTSRAGATPTKTTQEGNLTLRESLRQAWAEQQGS